jgi:murein DD-endopeptidase MepM/ murein hydrolase activator NlpD
MAGQGNSLGKIGLAIGLALALAVVVLPGQLSRSASARQNVHQPIITAIASDEARVPSARDNREPLLRQTAQDIFAQHLSSDQTFEVGLTNIIGEWAVVNFRVYDLTVESTPGWDVHVGLAYWNGTSWNLALEDSDEFATWLDEIPDALISVEARQFLIRPTVSTASDAPGLWLPFPVGQTWKYLAGPNGGSGRIAIDFGPFGFRNRLERPNPTPTPPLTGRERDVIAAATGIVIDRTDNSIVIRHGSHAAWETGYTSLASASIGVGLGQMVFQGQRIGAASAEIDPTKGVHLHFWVRKDGLDQIIDGQVLSEWRIFQDNGYSVGQNAGRIVYKDGTEKIDCRTVEVFELPGDQCHVKHFSVEPDPLPAATISFEPITITVPLSDTGVTKVVVDNAPNLYGVDLRLTYTPATSITVVDAFPDIGGIQLVPGTVFDDTPNAVIQNVVDPALGLIRFQTELQVPASAFNGNGSLIEITWQRLFTGPVQLSLDEINLTDPNGRALPVVISPTGQIDIQSGLVLQGQVELQGTADWGGVTLDTASRQIQTGSNGRFKIGVHQNYRLTLSVPGYLSAVADGTSSRATFADSDTVRLGRVVLLGGDVTGDDRINIFDLAFIGRRFHSDDPLADVNGDGTVNIFDMTITAANYGQFGPITTWQPID